VLRGVGCLRCSCSPRRFFLTARAAPPLTQVAGAIAAAVAVGTAYVLIHEHRRKGKKERKLAATGGAGSSSDSPGLSAARLIEVLGESANAAYQLIEQTRKMVHEKHTQTGQSLETCVDELQRDFESAMEAVIGSIRAKHGVSEAQMTEAMVANQQDPTVHAAVTALREAMNGKPPPGYRAAAEKSDADAAKARMRRAGKQRRKG